MWPDLPPDLLCEISGRLHISADFIRFHAVCKPCRSSHQQSCARKKTTDQFLPWMLAPINKEESLKFRCIFSKSSYLLPPPISGTGDNWVASADGTSVRCLTSGPTLTDPLTGDVTHLPPFTDIDGQWEKGNTSGIIYKDGTVLLYTSHDNDIDTSEFRAALLRPGDEKWTVVQRTILYPYYRTFCVAYHSSKILVTTMPRLWHVVTPSSEEDVLVPAPCSIPLQHQGYLYQHGHVLDCCGQLVWAIVHMRTDFWQKHGRGARDLSHALSVSVHALQDAPDHPRWVLKKGISLANLVLFLGWPNSFSVHASRLGMKGGFVYFTHCFNQSGVYRYNLVDDTTEFIERLPQGWHLEMCTWLLPQPTIAPLNQSLATAPRSNNMISNEKRRRP